MKERMNRRMFMRGAGGAVLAIPFLPSLTSKAFAQDAPPPPVGKCFFAVSTEHGDLWNGNLYPSDALFDQTLPYAGRDVRYGRLPSNPDQNGNVAWSPVLTASARKMTPALAAKFNVLRGLDIPYRISHHFGGYLGNFAGNETGILPNICGPGFAVPTIDQVMAYSPSFYTEADLTEKMTQRAFCVAGQQGSTCHISQTFTAPSAGVGSVVRQRAFDQNQSLHRYLFQPASAYHGIDTTIIDRVKTSFDMVKRHPRLSQGDRRRLDQHVESMFEIERKVQVAAAAQNAPARPGTDSDLYLRHHSFPHDPVENALYCDLMTDVIALGFSTGVSRIGTWSNYVRFSDQLINDWHGQVGHSGFGASVAQHWAVTYNQGTFEHILVNLAAKLDAIATHDGRTLLDHSVLMQNSEAGQVTHHSGCVNYPVVMAGGGGGFFNTGLFVDFSNQNRVYRDLSGVLDVKPGMALESPGLLYNQFLANVLLAMGLPPAEWERFTEFSFDGPARSTPTKGYGYFHVDPHRAADYALAKPLMSDPLPVITGA